MAAIRMLFSWLTEKGVLAMNDRRRQKVLLEDMDRNAELGISLQMSSTVKCGVSRMNVVWERILE